MLFRSEEALVILKKPNEIDLVILDVKLPGLGGIEVLGQIKKINPNLGIIIITAFGSKDVALEAWRGRADEYIEKPFNVDKTKKIIDRILEEKKVVLETFAGDIEGKLKRLKLFIQRNVDKKITLVNAAELICLSPKYLSRVFKERVGLGFNDYKLKIKFNAAKDFLKNTRYNVNQISEKLGYLNVESFMRQFQKRTGYTPTGYRKRHRIKTGK